MGDNLIDLSVEENTEPAESAFNPVAAQCDEENTGIKHSGDLFPPIPLTEGGRNSLDNNPFDCLQKIATKRHDDPFDIIEKEASLNIKVCRSNMSSEIKTADLLNLNDEGNDELAKEKTLSDLDIVAARIHSVVHSDLESESPPATMLLKLTPDSTDRPLSPQLSSCSDGSSPGSSASATSSKTSKTFEYRKRLLKLSLSNAASHTPVSHIKVKDMLADESPIKLVEEDLMSELPPMMVTSEAQFEADLKMMQFNTSLSEDKNSGELADAPEKNDSKASLSNAGDVSTVSPLPDLEQLRSRLKLKRDEGSSKNTNDSDIMQLVGSLQSLICEGELGDEEKKREAKSLLDTLTAALRRDDKLKETNDNKRSNSKEPTPRPFVRQGTFDVDLEGEKSPETNVSNETVDIASCGPGQPMEEIPDVMLRSSATYNGDSPPLDRNIVLPEIESVSPTPPNVNEIVEQLQHVLEQLQLTKATESSTCGDSGNSSLAPPSINPTFIVVVPTTSAAHNQQLTHHLQSSFIEDTFDSGSTAMRRRSQSLSIHDKIRVVQLPVPPLPAKGEPTPSISPPNQLSTPSKTPRPSNEANAFKTPARALPRRYSFSHATPQVPGRLGVQSNNNPSVYSRRSINAASSTAKSPCRPSNTRRLSTVKSTATDHQTTSKQRQPPLPSDMGAFKKVRPKARESILGSLGPLKATLPIKSVAPMVRVSPNTPLKASGTKGVLNRSIADSSICNKSLVNASMQMVSKSGPMSQTSSTPIAPARNAYRPPRDLSHIPTTPISKAYLTEHPGTSLSGGIPKRRSTLESKSKSPMKAKTAAISTGSTRQKSVPKAWTNQFRRTGIHGNKENEQS